MNKDSETIIEIDGGDTFCGTFEQFRDCFFDNATRETISLWAKKNDSTVKFVSKDEYSKMTR